MMNEYRKVRNQEYNQSDRFKFMVGGFFVALISAICVTVAFRTPVYGATTEEVIEVHSISGSSNAKHLYS